MSRRENTSKKKAEVITNKSYFIFLIVVSSGLSAAGIIWKSSPQYWIWWAAGLVLYFWCKDALTGKGWLRQQKAPAVRQMTDDERMAAVLNEWDDDMATLPALNSREREGYTELTRLCVAPLMQPALLSLFAAAGEAAPEAKPGSTLNEMAVYLEQKNLSFFIRLDWKAPVSELVWELRHELKNQFAMAIDLPPEDGYGDNATVSFTGIFADYDHALRNHGLQMGFINTDSDEYILVIHKTTDGQAVRAAAGKMGYPYATADALL